MPAHASSLPAGGACISSIPVNPARMAAYQKARMKIPPAVTRWSSSTIHMNTLLGYPWNGMVGADLDGLEAYGFAYPLSTQAATDWLEGDDLAKVNAFLKETCKEVFGILPGADDGGYSLSGEAREAALSRFALPENRKAALNMIRKLNESRDSNDNAL